MSLEFKLSVHVKEGSIDPKLVAGSSGNIPQYICAVDINSDGKRKLQTFNDGLSALKYTEDILRDWLNTIVGMKRDTIKKNKVLKQTIKMAN